MYTGDLNFNYRMYNVYYILCGCVFIISYKLLYSNIIVVCSVLFECSVVREVQQLRGDLNYIVVCEMYKSLL